MYRIVSSLLLAIAVSSAAAADKAGPILVGQSAGFTGGQAQYSADVKNGIQAYFNVVNKGGGVNGRALELVTEDD
jgi:branched-chain amino acid transport system substrate-binding protein